MPDWRRQPRRPALTPAFLCGMVVWGSCAGVYAACMDIPARTCCALAIGSALVGVIALACALGFGKGTAAVLLASLCMGACLASADAYRAHAEEESVGAPETAAVRLTLLEDCSDAGYAPRALCAARLDGGRMMVVQATLSENEYLTCGCTVEATGTLQGVKDGDRAYGWQRGTLLAFEARSVGESGEGGEFGLFTIRRRAITALAGDDAEHALLQALACGYRPPIRETRAYGCFQTVGLAHLVAVSGAHLVIVVGLASAVLNALRAPRKLCVVVLAAFMAAYTMMAGMPISCIRAAVMSSVGVLALFGKRRPSSLNALGVSLMALLAFSPHAAVSASLALSALSTTGIVVFSPLADRLMQGRVSARTAALLQPLSLTLCAGLLSQLYACSLFGQLPVVSGLSNLVCAPLFPVCCLCGLLAALSGAAGLAAAPVVAGCACIPARLLVWVVGMLSSMPYACVPFCIHPLAALAVSFAGAAALWAGWERCASPSFVAVAFVCAVAVILGAAVMPRADGIALLDVGQGDAFLLRSKGATLLVDTGNQDRLLVDQLARMGVWHLDGVMVTHADDDHCGSLDALERIVEVGTVYLHEGVLDSSDERCERLVSQSSLCAKHVVGVRYGDILHVGAFSIRIVWPHALVEDGGNADSIVAVADFDENGDGATESRILLTGDAEYEQIAQILGEIDLGRIDILKVGHHGSKNAMSAEQLRELDPSIALIGVGEGNRYGHPSPEIIDMLRRQHCTVFRSDEDGGVLLELHENAVRAHGI